MKNTKKYSSVLYVVAGYVLLLCCDMIWGGSYLVIKDITMITQWTVLIFLQKTITFCAIATLWFFTKKQQSLWTKDKIFYGALFGITHIVYLSCFSFAVSKLPISLASLLTSLVPTISLVIASCLYGVRYSARTWIGTWTTLCGIVLVLTMHFHVWDIFNTGDTANISGATSMLATTKWAMLCLLVATVSISLYNSFLRRLEVFASITEFLYISSGMSFLFSMPLLYIQTSPAQACNVLHTYTPQHWAELAYLGIIVSLITYYFYVQASLWVTNPVATLVTSINILIATILGVCIAHEPASPALWWGAVLVTTGILMTHYYSYKNSQALNA
jgi:drug/metabolite transporter (DMT)-like permease